MNEQGWLIGILAVIAVAVGVQTAALVAAARALRRLEARLDLAERELRDLRPRLERLGQLIDRVADWSDEAAARLPRASAAIDSGIDAAQGLARLGGALFLRRLGPLGTAWAVWQGLKSGASAYRRLRPGRSAVPQASLPPVASSGAGLN